jgi:hypothetical protein
MPGTVEGKIETAFQKSIIFVGKVIEVVGKPDSSYVKVIFKTEKVWNKKFQSEFIISTAKYSASCGYIFEVGKKYLVYAYEENKNLTTTNCTRTAPAEANKDIAVLNKIKKSKIKSALK